MIELDIFPRRSRVPVIRQSEQAECGIASMAMVLSYYGRVVDLRDMRVLGGATLAGSTLRDLIELAQRTGLEARGVRLEPDTLAKLRLPAILHWNMDHFVVLERVNRHGFEIIDPGVGRVRLSAAEFGERFSGIALELWTGDHFKTGNTATRIRYRDLLRQTRGLGRHLAVIFIFSLTSALVALVAPQYVQYAIDQAVVNENPGNLIGLAVAFSLIMAFGVGVSLLNSFSILNLRTLLLFQFRRNLFRHLFSLPSRYFQGRSVGDIMSRIDSYDQIQDTFSVEAIESVIQALMAVTIAVLLFFYSPMIFSLVCLYALASFALNLALLPAQRARSMKAVTVRAEADSQTIESVRGSRSIKALAIEERVLDTWSTRQVQAVNAELGVARLAILQQTLEEVLQIANTILIPGVALYLVIVDELTLGMFYAVNVYKAQLIEALEALIAFGLKLAQDTVHLERIGDIALEGPEDAVGEPSNDGQRDADGLDAGVSLPAELESIKLDNVCFRHGEGRPWILKSVSLALEKGGRVGLVGPSGAGKTTLLNLFASLVRPVEGALEVNGRELGEGQLRAYRQRLGIVSQDETLFTGSLASNVARLAGTIDMDRVIEVCTLADVHEEIVAMPMAYRTLVGDMGSALSTGQRQRVLLARALYDKPAFLLLDEGTSHLRKDSERRILEHLNDLPAGILFAVHGTAALDFCDHVFHLEAGELRELSEW